MLVLLIFLFIWGCLHFPFIPKDYFLWITNTTLDSSLLSTLCHLSSFPQILMKKSSVMRTVFPPIAKLSSLFHCFKGLKKFFFRSLWCVFGYISLNLSSLGFTQLLEFVARGLWPHTGTFQTVFISGFFSTFPFLFSSETLMTQTLNLWLWCHRCLDALFIVFSNFSLCCSDLAISIILFSSSLIWSGAPSILLLSPPSFFYMLFYVLVLIFFPHLLFLCWDFLFFSLCFKCVHNFLL